MHWVCVCDFGQMRGIVGIESEVSCVWSSVNGYSVKNSLDGAALIHMGPGFECGLCHKRYCFTNPFTAESPEKE